MPSPARVAVLVVSLLLTASCSPSLPELEPLVAPDISNLEAPVQSQLTDALARVEKIGAVSDNREVLGRLYGALGQLYLAYGLVESAQPALINAARLQPDEYDWQYLLGHLYFSSGQTDLAAHHLSRALDIRRDDLPALVTLGLLSLERGQVEQVTSVSERLLAEYPDSAAGYYLGGRAALLAGDYETAVARLERALEIEPEADRTFHPLAQAYRALGMTERANEAQRRAGNREITIKDDLYGGLSSLRKGSSADVDRGREALKKGRPQLAVEWLREAVDADPQNARGWLALGTALGELGRTEEAREAFQRVLDVTPNYAAALLNIGATYAREGNDTEAIAWYRRALDQNPDVEGGYLNLANALERTGRCPEALPLFEKAWLQEPSDPRPRLGAAKCLTATGYHHQALRSLEAGVTAQPKEPILRGALAHYLLTAPIPELRDPARALQLAQEALAMARTPAALATLALAQASNGDFEAAVETQQEAIAAAEEAGWDDDQRDRLTQDLVVYEAGLLPQN